MVSASEANWDASQYYGLGLMALDEKNLRKALECFRKAFNLHPPLELQPAVKSYYGFTMVMVEGREGEGFRLMHQAASQDMYRPEFYVNLGRAYWQKKGNRKQALNALYNGLRFAPKDPAILAMLREMGTRKPPVIKFLKRKNPINRWLGSKLRRRAVGESAIHV